MTGARYFLDILQNSEKILNVNFLLKTRYL